MKSNLNNPLRNINLHGFNFTYHSGVILKSFASVLGCEVQIRVGKPAETDKEQQLEYIDHTLYEIKRIFDDEIVDLDRTISIFFEVLGRFYQKVSKFKKV